MKWTYSIKNKITAATVLFALCLLVLLSNYNDRVHTREVKQSISTLYEDRLLVESYILHLTSHIYQIREGFFRADSSDPEIIAKRSARLAAINKIMEDYEKTKFTEAEKIEFARFKSLFRQVESNSNNPQSDLNLWTLDALDALYKLSDIQIEESTSILSHSEQLYRTSKISSDFGFALVIIILLILQALVSTSKTFYISNKTDPANLN
ncbi:MAG: MCP four helix bundle domain-containing protein [Saprospiraceae bacterium]|nr:MCP four helix bundle domain-containing protein [Saprospiraceae bacterium]